MYEVSIRPLSNVKEGANVICLWDVKLARSAALENVWKWVWMTLKFSMKMIGKNIHISKRKYNFNDWTPIFGDNVCCEKSNPDFIFETCPE